MIVDIDSSDKETTPPVESGGFFRRLFKFRVTYRPDEPRMSRWRWWVVLVFLPPVALLIVWKDKKLLKQMALVMFFGSVLIMLALLLYLTYFSSVNDHDMPWNIIFPSAIPLVVFMMSGLFLAVYAQYTIIKMEKCIQKE